MEPTITSSRRVGGPEPSDAVGVVFGNVTTTEFRFAVRDPTLRRLDYVQVDHPSDGSLVAHVVEVTRETSLTFEEAQRLGYGDAPQRDHLVARARVIGFRDANGRLQAPRTPVAAGATVRRVDETLLAHVFGLRDTEGAFIGTVKGYSLKVFLDINTLVQKHLSILAKTGSGKSYAVGVLMEELIKQGVPIVIVDPHGEHASLARPNTSPQDQAARRRFGVTPRNYAEHIVEYSPDTVSNPDAVPFRLESRNLDAREISEVLGKVTNSQMGMLHAAVKELQDREEDYDLQDVLEGVRESASNAKWNLVSALESLVGRDVFSGPGTTVESLVQPKKVSILNLKGVSPDLQEMVVATTARRLFEARKLGKVPPFMLVVEEAHNFAPEKGLSGSPSGLVLRTVASEGRKFGMGLAVVSQRPAKVDKNVLSQCNTQIMLKVTNPNDLKALAASAEGFTSESEDEIQRLPVGVAFVSHPRISIPVLVEVRPRETSHGGESVDVMASIRDAEPKAARVDADAELEEDDEDEAETVFEVVPKRAAKPKQARLPREPAPQPSPPTLDAPHPAAAPRARTATLPAWVSAVAEEERVVARSDLKTLSLPQLQALHVDLAVRARELAADRSVEESAAPLRARIDAHLLRIQDLIEQRDSEARSIRGRLKGLMAKARPPRVPGDEPERIDLSAATVSKTKKAPAKSPSKGPAAKKPVKKAASSSKTAAKRPAKGAKK